MKVLDNMPITWTDHEDVAMSLYEKFGDEFTEIKIYRIRFTELIEWVLSLPNLQAPGKNVLKGTWNKSNRNGYMNGAIINNFYGNI